MIQLKNNELEINVKKSGAELTSIKYKGTEEEWSAISKGYAWDFDTGNYTITYNYQGE